MSGYVEQDIVTADGQRIVSRLFVPENEIKGAVLVVPAMGASQSYYLKFAAWLAAQGFLTATFDYRGTGLSRPPDLRGFKADLFDWARLDCAAMLDALQARAAGKPLYWLGHSFGGHILPIVSDCGRVTKMITIAAGSGYWRDYAPSRKPLLWWLWYVVVPFSLKLFGYYPGKRLRKIGDLPKGVMEQWRRWCTNADYSAGAEGQEIRAGQGAPAPPGRGCRIDQYRADDRPRPASGGFIAQGRDRSGRLARPDLKTAG